MNENRDIVYLESASDRWRGRWRAMSRIARMGIVSTIFGVIGLLGCLFLSFIPYLALPFSLVGLVIGSISFMLGFYQNLRRDGFWFPLAGTVVSLLGVAIAIGGWANYTESQQEKQTRDQLDAEQEILERFVGRWLKSGDQQQQSLEMTRAGSLLWKGTETASDSETTVARYQLKGAVLVISFGESSAGGQRSIVRYSVDTSSADRLLLGDRRLISGNANIDMSGVWNRVGPPRVLTAAEKEIADYQQKLDRFRAQQEKITNLLSSFQMERDELLEKLRPWRDTSRPRDDSWRIRANELNKLVHQIELLEQQQPELQQAIVRLESAISRLGRKAKLDQAGINTEQMEQLLVMGDRLGDDLESIKAREAVEELLLEDVVEEAFRRASEKKE